MAKAVPFVVFPPGCRVCVKVRTGEAEDSAARIQQALLGNLELSRKGAWHMLETWKGSLVPRPHREARAGGARDYWKGCGTYQ